MVNMSELPVDKAIIRQTQNTLGKFVKKPNLSDKLLSKPPFRFLFDVLSVVISQTGVFQGLYTADELKYTNIKGREDKMRFLQKIIDVVELAANISLELRTSKIVAGHQADKTNKLLQCIAEIIEKKLNWRGAVEKVLRRGEKQAGKTDDASKETKRADKDKGRSKTGSKSVQQSSHNKNGKSTTGSSIKKENSDAPTSNPPDIVPKNRHDSNKKPLKPKTETEQKEMEKKVVLEGEQEKQKTKDDNDVNFTEIAAAKSSPKLEEEKRQLDRKPLPEDDHPENKESKLPDENKQSEVPTETGIDYTESALKHTQRNSFEEKHSESKQNNIVEKQQPSAEIINKKLNEDTAPDHPPIGGVEDNDEELKVKRETTFTREDQSAEGESIVNEKESREVERPQNSLRPPSVRPPSARPGAPRRRDRNVEVIIDSNTNIKAAGIDIKLEPFIDLEEGESVVLVGNSNEHDNEMNTALLATGNDQGHLVQQILETQKELLQSGEDAKKKAGSGDKLKRRQSSNQPVANISETIQSLTQCVNPLGKLFEFIPEDIDAMQLEYRMWLDQCLMASSDLRKEQLHRDTAIDPLRIQLSDLEEQITEYREKIDICRLHILQNREKLFKFYGED